MLATVALGLDGEGLAWEEVPVDPALRLDLVREERVRVDKAKCVEAHEQSPYRGRGSTAAAMGARRTSNRSCALPLIGCSVVPSLG